MNKPVSEDVPAGAVKLWNQIKALRVGMNRDCSAELLLEMTGKDGKEFSAVLVMVCLRIHDKTEWSRNEDNSPNELADYMG